MRTIPIGTCIPGRGAQAWLPAMVEAGFECFSINFHMSLGGVTLEEQARTLRDMLDGTGREITTLGYYCNALANDEHYQTMKRVIECAPRYGAKIVSTFAGALEGEPMEAALPRFKEVYSDLAARAQDAGVRIAFENCPMGGTWKRATCNIAYNPLLWEKMFDAVPSDALGLEWEPAHQMAQLIDPIAQLRFWAKKVYHVHGKDSNVRWDLIQRVGIHAQAPIACDRTPGFGDCDWRVIFDILRQNDYAGDICVEGYHDPFFKRDWEMTGQLHALRYLRFCRGGDFSPNPWDA